MRNYLSSLLMGAAIGSIMTFMYTQQNDSAIETANKQIQAMPKKALNFLQNMSADLMGK